MTTPNCGSCRHWNLSDDRLAPYGFGKCDKRSAEIDRMAISTSAQNLCRLGKHQAAESAVLVRREKTLGTIL